MASEVARPIVLWFDFSSITRESVSDTVFSDSRRIIILIHKVRDKPADQLAMHLLARRKRGKLYLQLFIRHRRFPPLW